MIVKPQSFVKSTIASHVSDIKDAQTFSWYSTLGIFTELKLYKLFQSKDQVKIFYDALVSKTKMSSTRKIWTRLSFVG